MGWGTSYGPHWEGILIHCKDLQILIKYLNITKLIYIHIKLGAWNSLPTLFWPLKGLPL